MISYRYKVAIYDPPNNDDGFNSWLIRNLYLQNSKKVLNKLKFLLYYYGEYTWGKDEAKYNFYKNKFEFAKEFLSHPEYYNYEQGDVVRPNPSISKKSDEEIEAIQKQKELMKKQREERRLQRIEQGLNAPPKEEPKEKYYEYMDDLDPRFIDTKNLPQEKEELEKILRSIGDKK